MAPMLKVGLPAAGFCNKLPIALRHGTTNNLGLNIPCMFLTQGIMNVMKYTSSISSNTILGQMLRLTEQSTKLELGLPGNLFTTPYHSTHFLVTPSWIKHLWKFAYEHRILLHDHSPPLLPSTDKDQFLMEYFLSKSFRPWELKAINKCRIYLT